MINCHESGLDGELIRLTHQNDVIYILFMFNFMVHFFLAHPVQTRQAILGTGTDTLTIVMAVVPGVRKRTRH